MLKFFFGMIFGIVVSTVGFSGMGRMADKGMAQLKSASEEAAIITETNGTKK